MMKTYIIDGNNLMHKIKDISMLQKKDRQSAREKLAFRLDNYFSNKNVKALLYFDGFGNIPVNTTKIKIIYSDNRAADEKIKSSIEKAANPKNIIVVTSDDEIRKLARACSCELIKSEEFGEMINKQSSDDEEEKKIKGMSNEEFKKLFGADE